MGCMPARSSSVPSTYPVTDLDAAVAEYRELGFVVLRELCTAAQLDALQVELEGLQHRLTRGELPERCGTVILDDPDALIDGEPFAHYVCHATQVSALVHDAVMHPAIADAAQRILGADAWLLDDDRFGVVYQDARPGPQSGYSRI